MTIQEAIEALEVAKAEVEWNYPMNYTVALDIAIKAMNKQIAKKPLHTTSFFDEDYDYCPCCKKIIRDFENLRICSYCGQMLNWKR